MWQLIVNFFSSNFVILDPRSANLFLVGGSPLPLIILISAYCALCRYGPRWMESRKEFELKPLITFYNFVQVTTCTYVGCSVNTVTLAWWIFQKHNFSGCIRFLLEVQVQLHMSAHWLQQQWIWKGWGLLHIRLLSTKGLGSLRYCELWADFFSILICSSHRFSSFWGRRTINLLFFIATIIAECFSWLICHRNGFLAVREFVSAFLTPSFIVWCIHTISWPPSSPSSRSQCGGRSTLPSFKLRSFAFCPSYFLGPCYQKIATTLS